MTTHCYDLKKGQIYETFSATLYGRAQIVSFDDETVTFSRIDINGHPEHTETRKLFEEYFHYVRG